MKRVANNYGIKVKFLGATNFLAPRVKLVQTNNNEAITLECNGASPLDQACELLETCERVSSYHVVIDNTQQDYYILSVDAVTGFSVKELI